MALVYWNHLGQLTFWIAAVKMVWINVLLSGNNLVPVAMACHSLPARQRLRGIMIAAILAISLCLPFTGIINWLMPLPYVNVIIGLVLIYIGVKALIPDSNHKDRASSGVHFWHVVRVATISNLVLTVDSVIATVAAAQGDGILIVIGLSVAALATILGAAFIQLLLDIAPAFSWAGSGLLGWIAGETIASDPFIEPHMDPANSHAVALIAASACAVLVPALGWGWRRARQSSPTWMPPCRETEVAARKH